MRLPVDQQAKPGAYTNGEAYFLLMKCKVYNFQMVILKRI